MRPIETDDALGRPQPPSPPLRLAVGPVFWRLLLISFVISELGVWTRVRRRIPRFRGSERIPLLLMLTPLALVRSLAIAAIITFVLDRLVRWFARPIAAHWYACHGSGVANSAIGFHLDPGERVLAETPARRRYRRGWRPGTLVRTDRAVWFFPVCWDHESWHCPLTELQGVDRQPFQPRFGTFVHGVPDQLLIESRSEGAIRFAVVDPQSVQSWLISGAVSAPEAFDSLVATSATPAIRSLSPDV